MHARDHPLRFELARPLVGEDIRRTGTWRRKEHVSDADMFGLISRHSADLDAGAKNIASAAYDNGSPDNLTVQIVRVEEVPRQGSAESMRAKGGLFVAHLPADLVQ